MPAAAIDLTPWRRWREMRVATSPACDEAKAQALAEGAVGFCIDGQSLLLALEASLDP